MVRHARLIAPTMMEATTAPWTAADHSIRVLTLLQEQAGKLAAYSITNLLRVITHVKQSVPRPVFGLLVKLVVHTTRS